MIVGTQAQLNFKDAPTFMLENLLSKESATLERNNLLNCTIHADEIFTVVCSAEDSKSFIPNVVMADTRSVIGD